MLFYRLLEEGTRRFAYRVHAFCLMTNHVHPNSADGTSAAVERPPEPVLNIRVRLFGSGFGSGLRY
jgi:hypothetical protein